MKDWQWIVVSFVTMSSGMKSSGIDSMNSSAMTLPPTMRAAVCTGYVEDTVARVARRVANGKEEKEENDAYDDILSVEEGVAVPCLGIDKPAAGFAGGMLVRVLSVALAPGDARVMSGKTRELQGPPEMPYVPGGDVCGVVIQLPPDKNNKEEKFKVGDVVAARFLNKPLGMLGEYAIVNTAVCDVVPSSVSPPDAAALASSGTVAVLLSERIRQGDRVLILGAGGGVGSHLCQMARVRGASYIVGVGRDVPRLKAPPISCDDALDYTQAQHGDVFSLLPQNTDHQEDPFDVVFDLAGGYWPILIHRYQQSRSSNLPIVKSAQQGGQYLTNTPDTPTFEAHSIWSILKLFLFPPLYRAIYTRFGYPSRQYLPKYSFLMSLPTEGDIVAQTLSFAKQGKLKACIDDRGPFPFTSNGVRNALRLMESRHAKGKVIIHVANP